MFFLLLGEIQKKVKVKKTDKKDIDIIYITKNNCQSSADRAKQIKTKAIVNEDPTEKLIRFIDLIPENIHRYHDEWWCFNTVFNDELVMVHLIHDFQSY